VTQPTASFPGPPEEVITVWHRHSRLHTAIAIHSTVRGPALGGTRIRIYPDLDAAIREVCNLAEAMSLKNAVAALPFGGGKAVLIGDPSAIKTPELIEDYAAVLNTLQGRYITAADVGSTQSDMDALRGYTKFVAGTSVSRGGSGDPSPMTALGVLCAMEAASARIWGNRELGGRHIAVSGLGKVGSELVRLLLERDCRISVADVSDRAVAAVTALGRVDVVATDRIHKVDCDIYAPCALGGILNDDSIGELACPLLVGAANNQLSTQSIAEDLAARGIVYVPDFVANAGGVINIAHEYLGYDAEQARAHVEQIFTTTDTILRHSAEQAITPLAAAMALAQERLAAGD
jgi:glutamate dehydrogenase/leucine dehydrogenase